MAAGNDERAFIRQAAREALERAQLDNPYLAKELVDGVAYGGDYPLGGELEPRDAAILYGALTKGITAALGDSALLGDSEYLKRRDEAAPI